MPNHLSNLGIFHTAISILALIAGIIALFRDGRINLHNGLGKWYVLLTVVTCITGFPIMKTGHISVGHVDGAIVLILLILADFARSIWKSPTGAVKAETIFLSVTLFLSFVPAITETLTRLPISQPIADGPDASLVKMLNGAAALIFLVIIIYQVRKLRKLTL